MFIIRRTDQGGGYVTPPGSGKSYTKKRDQARVFKTRAEAEADRCVENEVIESAYTFHGQDRQDSLL